MNSFNDNLSKEENLYYDLVNAFDINCLDEYCETYKELITAKVKMSPTLIDIKNMLSLRKDQLISSALEKNEIKTKTEAQFYVDDIKSNNWKVSERTLKNLMNLLNKTNYSNNFNNY